jgi:alpha-tubulin suppressor-like RCC1 family protein
MAGAQSVLGCFCPTFQKCEALGDDVVIDKIAAGFAHCAAAAASGELYCWGKRLLLLVGASRQLSAPACVPRCMCVFLVW